MSIDIPQPAHPAGQMEVVVRIILSKMCVQLFSPCLIQCIREIIPLCEMRGVFLNLRGRMKKLQTAILNTGLVIKINQSQFFSVEQKSMITSYRICTPVNYYSEKYQEWKVTDYEIMRTCSMPEVVFCLLDIYKAVSG